MKPARGVSWDHLTERLASIYGFKYTGSEQCLSSVWVLTGGRALADNRLLLTDSIIQLRSGRYIENRIAIIAMTGEVISEFHRK